MPIAVAHKPLDGLEEFMRDNFPPKPIQAPPADSERIRSHPEFHEGTHITHLLRADGLLIECRATTPSALTELLTQQGLSLQPAPVLTARSEFRTAWKPASESREERKSLNVAHEDYLAGKTDLADYTDRIWAFLDARTDQENVTAFMAENFEAMADRSFGPKDKKPFSQFLLAAWNTYREEHGLLKVIVGPRQRDGRQGMTVEGSNCLAGLKKAELKSNFEELWHKMLTTEGIAHEFAIEDVFDVCLRVARPVVEHRMSDLRELAITADDAVSETVVSFWKSWKAGKVKGSPYAHLRSIAYNKGTDAFNGNLEQSAATEPLEIEDKDDPRFTIDNPAIQRTERRTFGPRVPKEIVGLDRLVWGYMREGLTYKQIAGCIGSTEGAVKTRVNRLKNRMEELGVKAR